VADPTDQNVNPYQPPAARVLESKLQTGSFVPGGRSCPAGAGLSWIGKGWTQFLAAPLPWIGVTLVYVVVIFVISVVPIVSLFSWLLSVVLFGGVYLGCRATDRGEPFEIRYLFAGFSEGFGRLAGIGAVMIAFNFAFLIVIGILFFVGMGLSAFPDFANLSAHWEDLSSAFGLVALLLLLMLIYLTFLSMVGLFAPILSAVYDQPVFESLKGSFTGSMRNLGSLTVFGLAWIVLFFLCILTLGLGFLVLLPVTWAAIYAAARDIYEI
jgi:uncharacterized membrane protein